MDRGGSQHRLGRRTFIARVRGICALYEEMSCNNSLSAYEDSESTKLLTEVEGTLIPEIVDKLVTDIFQASASNW